MMNIEKRLPGSYTYDSITKIAPPTVVIAGPDYKAEIAELLENFLSEAGIKSINLKTDELPADQVARAIYPANTEKSFNPTAIFITGNRTQSIIPHLTTQEHQRTPETGRGEAILQEILGLLVREELTIPLLFLLSGGILETEMADVKKRIITSSQISTEKKSLLHKRLTILPEIVYSAGFKAIIKEILEKHNGTYIDVTEL